MIEATPLAWINVLTQSFRAHQYKILQRQRNVARITHCAGASKMVPHQDALFNLSSRDPLLFALDFLSQAFDLLDACYTRQIFGHGAV